MNKTKRVAWHKQLRKVKKTKEKLRLARKSGAAAAAATRR
jgi:hypothetical protein